ncbi:MAG: NADH-dependent [FeFe] hydrogenase, group A6 [Candidatus Ozemobacteraceae bacterium]|jgi:NADH-quinone oxidoreductase subunit G
MTTDKFVLVNGQEVPIEGEKNLLELIRKAGIEIPTLCYHPKLSVYGACRLCVVEIEGRGIQTSCSTEPEPGMKIKTHTPALRNIRKVAVELFLANHKVECPTCDQMGNCKLEEIARKLGVNEVRFKKKKDFRPADTGSVAIYRDPDKCVLCGQCVRYCKEIHGIGAIDFAFRGKDTYVTPAFDRSVGDGECVNCGQCAAVCPVGAIVVKKHISPVQKALDDKTKTVVVHMAPAVRAGIGEEFGLVAGPETTGKMVAALRKLGFDKVYDTVYAADLTIMEEGTEFVNRLTKGGVLPQFTSCCPGWIKFIEEYYPELLPNLSSCKSPQQMMGAVMRELLPEQLGVKNEDLFVVSVMPCTAKKFEIRRPEFEYTKGKRDTDEVITVQELARMIKGAGIDFANLKPEEFDMPLGDKTGAGVIFGVTGGVTEAALRFAVEKVTGKVIDSKDLDYKAVRGSEGLLEATLDVEGTKLRIAIVHGLSNAHTVCKELLNGEVKYDFIEVMTCPGGCINGGGQPIDFNQAAKIERRTKQIYEADKNMPRRKSQDNPAVIATYEKLLKEPCGEKSHHLLHTHYYKRNF